MAIKTGGGVTNLPKNERRNKSPLATKGYRSRQPSLFESRHLLAKKLEKTADKLTATHDGAKSAAKEMAKKTASDAAKLKKEWQKLSRRSHGGDQTVGRRKEFRPLDKKKWTHLILKSEKAVGAFGLLRPKNQIFIAELLDKKARKFNVAIQSYANVGNHLHMKLKFANREDFQNFLRSITTLIARFVTGARKGKPFGKFWQGLAYTRVVTTKKEELQLRGYIAANLIEVGSSKSERNSYLTEFNAWVRKLHRSAGP
jgi:hypothetical protein